MAHSAAPHSSSVELTIEEWAAMPEDEPGELVDGIVADVPGCPGLALDLDALWADVDRLGPPDDP